MTSNKATVMTSQVSKIYDIGGVKVEAVCAIDLKITEGQFVSLMGPSGSGKTTLLNLIGGIDKPTSGKIEVLGEELSTKDEDFLASFRCSNVGFVFQAYNLISTLSVAENIAFPMEWSRKPETHIKKRVEELLALFNIQQRADHFPSQLSGGEQQRVAFARALANNPPLLLVDEPTGNLDTKTSQSIIQILQTLKNERKTIIVATHDERIVQLADQKLQLEDGKLVG